MTTNRADVPTRAVKASSVAVVVAHSNIPGSHAVTMTHTTGKEMPFVVTYGEEVTACYSGNTALVEFGHCVRHAMECAGLLDD